MINIVVPMAGRGSRFAGTGERGPKPLIEVEPGRIMLDYVADYLHFDEPCRLILVSLVEHAQDPRLQAFMRRIGPEHRLLLTERVTDGPAATALLARGLIGEGEELLVAYCDCAFALGMQQFVEGMRRDAADGGVLIYPSSGPMEAYARLEGERVRQIAEKQVISGDAVAGVYYFRRGGDFIAAAQRLLARRAAGEEVFVSSTYQLMIAAGQVILGRRIAREQRIEMGTPDDLERARAWLTRSRLAADGAGAPN